jgi:hypothetical protein
MGELELVPDVFRLAEDVSLFVADEFRKEAIKNNEQGDIPLSFEIINNAANSLLQLHVKTCSAFLDKLLWVRFSLGFTK